jgi:YgiT-type zinc finger domain-containing protein
MNDSNDSDKLKTQPCPACGSVMRYEKRDNVIEYQGHLRAIETLGWWCQGCGEAILSGDSLLAYERELNALRDEVNNKSKP